LADALEAVGQDMEENAADELGRCQCHVLDARSVAVVLSGEGDAIVESDRGRQRLLAVDHPIEPPELGKAAEKVLASAKCTGSEKYCKRLSS
jgi:hypothetical protein